MAVSTSALNLADYALNANSSEVRAVTWSLIDNGAVAQDLPILTSEQLILNGVRFEGNLPTVNWSQINAEGVSVKATPTTYTEQVYTFRNYVDIDKLLVRDKNQITDPRATQASAMMKAVAYDFNDKFINNDHVSGDENSLIGINYRIINAKGVRSENKIDGGGVDMTQAGMTQATANKFLELVDQLLWSVDSPDGSGVIIYCNEVMKRRWAFALRLMGTSGGFDITKDQFDRVVQMYKGAVIRDIGYKADQSTRIITNTFLSDGTANTGSTYTCMYACNMSTDHLMGWQFEPPNSQDLGLLNNGVTYRTLFDWAIGLNNVSNRSLARIHGIKMS